MKELKKATIKLLKKEGHVVTKEIEKHLDLLIEELLFCRTAIIEAGLTIPVSMRISPRTLIDYLKKESLLPQQLTLLRLIDMYVVAVYLDSRQKSYYYLSPIHLYVGTTVAVDMAGKSKLVKVESCIPFSQLPPQSFDLKHILGVLYTPEQITSLNLPVSNISQPIERNQSNNLSS